MVRVARKPKNKTANAEPEAVKSAKAIIIKTTEMPTRMLQVYHRNPRVGDLGKIAESLENNGQFRPILVNAGKLTGRKNEVLAGNHTFLAARHLGWETITASLIDVDDDRARAIVLADNATAEAGTYDAKELAELVQEAKDAGVVAGIGFDEEEMNAILKSVPKINHNDLTPPTISLHELGIDTKPKDKREKMLEERNAAKSEADRNRGNSKIDISEDTDIEDMDEPSEDRAAQLSLARVQAQLELMEGENWFGSNDWQIPDLREDMLVESVPEDILCWAGNEATPDDGQQWFIYNYSLGGMKGLPIDRTILSFFTHDDKFSGWWDLPAYYTAKMLVQGLTQAICPDNSFYFTMPRVLHLRGVYQSQWMGRFFQEAGIKVIPRIQFDDIESLKFNMLGIPKRPPVIATSLQNFEGTLDERTQQCRDALILMQNCVDKLRPTNQIIVYGGETLQKQLHILDGRGAQVIGVRNYVSMRRGTAFDKKEGTGGLSAADKKRIRSEVEADAESKGVTIRRRVKVQRTEDE